jgi:hypothetical protein
VSRLKFQPQLNHFPLSSLCLTNLVIYNHLASIVSSFYLLFILLKGGKPGRFERWGKKPASNSHTSAAPSSSTFSTSDQSIEAIKRKAEEDAAPSTLLCTCMCCLCLRSCLSAHGGGICILIIFLQNARQKKARNWYSMPHMHTTTLPCTFTR